MQEKERGSSRKLSEIQNEQASIRHKTVLAAAKRLLFRSLYVAFCDWSEKSFLFKRQRATISKIVRMLRKRGLHLSWNLWSSLHHERERQKRVMRRVAMTFANRWLMRAWAQVSSRRPLMLIPQSLCIISPALSSADFDLARARAVVRRGPSSQTNASEAIARAH